MCGIVGTTAVAVDIDKALDAIAHRGPDARGVYTRKGVTGGHVRLSIVDTGSRSDQPFVYGDGVLCFNGEIWNYRALRSQLEKLGHSFETEGDTEVLAAALSQWGHSFLPHIEGMFAFSWQHPRDGLILARDRFGEVPLHVAHDGKALYWSSEIKGLAAMGVPGRAVMWMPPGTYLQGGRFHTWYDKPKPRRDWTKEAASKAYQAELQVGAEERAMADVPVCALLSGGIDSAAVVWELSKLMPGIVCYVAAPESGTSKDVECAREVADLVGADLRVIRIPPPTTSDLSDVIAHIEMPHKAQVEIAWACLHLAREMQRDGFKVTYSGEGADELLASYNFARHATIKKGWHEARWDMFRGQHRKNFARCNKVFMAHGVECRLPFLHTGLAEAVLSMPREVIRDSDRDKDWKAVAVRAYPELPASVLQRLKAPFQDGARLKEIALDAVADPARFYRAEHQRISGSTP